MLVVNAWQPCGLSPPPHILRSSGGNFSTVLFVQPACVLRCWISVFLVAFLCGLHPIDRRWRAPRCCFLAAVSHMGSAKWGEKCNYLFPLFGFPKGHGLQWLPTPLIITALSPHSFSRACIVSYIMRTNLDPVSRRGMLGDSGVSLVCTFASSFTSSAFRFPELLVFSGLALVSLPPSLLVGATFHSQNHSP